MSFRGVTVLLAAGVALCAVAGVARPGAASDAQPDVRTLDNGLKVAFFQDSDLPIVEIVLVVPAGTASPDSEAGTLAWPAAALLSHGTTSRDARAFANAIEGLGGTFSSQATRDQAVVSATFLARDFDAGIELVSDAVLRPALIPSEVDVVRRQIAGNAARLRQNPASEADLRVWAGVFADHPYGRPPLPRLADVQSITGEGLRAFLVRAYDPAHSVLAIGGDIPAEQAFAAAKAQFGDWTSSGDSSATRGVAPVPAGGKPRIVIVDRPKWDRAEMRIGFRLPALGDPDEPAVALAADVLAEGPDSRLAALSGGTTFAGGVVDNRVVLGAAGLAAIGGNVPADSAAWALERLREAIAGLSSRPPGQAELSAARRLEVYATQRRGETLRGRMTDWCTDVVQGQAADFETDRVAKLESADADEVAAAVRRWLDPARAVTVLVGPAERLVREVGKLGDVEAFTAEGVEIPSGLFAPAQPPSPEAVARGRELVSQALAAHGGLAKLRGIEDSAMDADITLHVYGNELPGRMREVRKDPYRMQFNTWISGVETEQTLNGDQAWAVNTAGDRSTFDLDSLQVAALRDGYASDVPHLLVALAADGVEVASLGRQRLDDRDVDAVAVRNPSGARWIAYFEATSHRLAGVDRREPPEAGGETSRRIYRDYKPVNGIQWPYSQSRLRGGVPLMDMSVTAVTLNGGIKDGLFEKPYVPEPLEPAPRR